MTNPGLRSLPYPPPGSIVVTRTTRLLGHFRLPGASGRSRRHFTHVTVMLPGTFENDAEALQFIRTLPSGDYAIERMA